VEAIVCSWCRGQNNPDARSCYWCGAPLDTTAKVTDSGWREAPMLRDLTEFRFSQSLCQVEGEIVPVAEMALAPGDSVFFEPHALLWKDEAVPLVSHSTSGGLSRMLGGMPFLVMSAGGPGRVAFSRNATGEVVVLPLHPSMELDVREHAFLVASHTIDYSFVRIKGFRNVMHGGGGMYMDRFVTRGEPGILLLHGYGNVFERTLAPGEQILLEPGGFLYKDSTVTMNIEQQDVRTGLVRHGLYLAEFTGPGRVGMQSMYVHHHTG
jgi:uncharacterized protein (AIM24 family)